VHSASEGAIRNDRRAADSDSVIALTKGFVQHSGSYRALDPHEREAADAALTQTTAELTGLGPSVVTAMKAQIIDGYKAGVSTLTLRGWLTPAQAALLGIFADSL
jgi:hypothetical protein